jgi:putative Mn2+ efflux pump MntP
VSLFNTTIINIIGKIIIGSALFTGYYLGTLVPESVGIWLVFSILAGLGFFKIAQPLWQKQTGGTKETIKWYEAAILGTVLSFDGVAMSIGTTVTNMPMVFIFVVLGMMLVTDQLVFMSANKLGFYLSKKKHMQKLNLDWLAGMFLILVASVKLIIESIGTH